MNEYLSAALEIVKAQATVRTMDESEISRMVKSVSEAVQALDTGTALSDESAAPATALTATQALKERSIVCLECGKSFKVLTKKHLATHAVTPEEYKTKYGYKKTQGLCAKSLQRERRAKMKDMKLWERRQKPASQEAAPITPPAQA